MFPAIICNIQRGNSILLGLLRVTLSVISTLRTIKIWYNIKAYKIGDRKVLNEARHPVFPLSGKNKLFTILILLCIMLKNGRSYFVCLAIFQHHQRDQQTFEYFDASHHTKPQAVAEADVGTKCYLQGKLNFCQFLCESTFQLKFPDFLQTKSLTMRLVLHLQSPRRRGQ